MANGICYLIDKTTYDKCINKARKIVTEWASVTHDSEAWKVFCACFQEGPTARATSELDEEHQKYSLWKKLWVDQTTAQLDPRGQTEQPLFGNRDYRKPTPSTRFHPTLQLQLSLLLSEKWEHTSDEDEEDIEEQGQPDMRPGYCQRSDAIEERLQWLKEENK